MKLLEKYSDHTYALMRIMTGFMFSFHGVQKIFGVLSEKGAQQVGSQMWIGGMIELLCGILIMIGLFSRWAAFLASGTMAVAYFQFHWKFQMDGNFFPTINKGELAAVYCFVFFHIACRGGVKWCADKN